MQNLSQAVLETMKRLRQENNHYLSLKVINNRLYVYESTTRWDKENRKVRSISRYLGRMTFEGRFIPGIKRDAELGLAGNENIFNAKIDRGAGARKHIEPKPYYSTYEGPILRQLSQNGRMMLADLGKKLGLKPSTISWHKRNIERKHRLSYLLELDIRKLRFSEYLIMIKFEKDRPSLREMRSEIEKVENIQLALLTQGDYDLILYALFPSGAELSEELMYIRGKLFSDYELGLYLTPIHINQGFVPLRKNFFTLLEKEIRKAYSQDIRPSISIREHLFLKNLDSDATMEFSQADKQNRFGVGSSKYLYGRLIEREILKRVTTSISDEQLKYISIIVLEEIRHSIFFKESSYINKCISSEKSLVDKYCLVGRVENPESLILVMPVFSTRDLDSAMSELEKIKGSRINRLIVTNVIVGRLCYRHSS